MSSVVLDSLYYSVSSNDLVERIAGDDGDSVSGRMERQSKKALEQIEEHAEPRALYRVVERSEDRSFDETMFNGSKKVSRVFEGCDEAAVFLVTMGGRIDDLIEESIKKRPSYGYILDTAASMAAEAAVDHVESLIEERLPDEQGITKRYSPGYCDWPLKGDSSFYDIVPYEKLDVELNENYGMNPRKSVSGIIGICPANSKDASGNACRFCNNFDCPYRRI